MLKDDGKKIHGPTSQVLKKKKIDLMKDDPGSSKKLPAKMNMAFSMAPECEKKIMQINSKSVSNARKNQARCIDCKKNFYDHTGLLFYRAKFHSDGILHKCDNENFTILL